MGWKRVFHYFHHRLFRQSDSTYRIAGGLATGAVVSFSPILGTHFIQALLFAYLFRQSKIASMMGTFWGNPWTLPPMFYMDYKLGVWLMTTFWSEDFVAMPHEHTLSYLLSEPMRLFLPMLIGGTILGIVCWPITYLILYYPVRRMQRAYHMRRMLRLKKKREVS